MGKPGSFVRDLWIRERRRLISFVISFLVDTAMGVLVIVVTFGVGLLLQFLQVYGLAESEAEVFERAHIWIDNAVYVTLGLDFLVRLIRGIWRDYHNDKD